MKVKALIGFVSTIDGHKFRVQAGDILDMPKDADWVQAGLVEKVTRTTRRSSRKKKDDNGS